MDQKPQPPTQLPTQPQPKPSQTEVIIPPDAPAVLPVAGDGLTPQMPNQTKPKRKIPLFLAAVLAGILVMTSVAVAYFGIYLPNQPEAILRDAVVNTINAESVKLEATYTVTNEGESITPVKLTGAMSSELASLTLTIDWAPFFTGSADLWLTQEKVYVRLNLTDLVKQYITLSGLPKTTTDQIVEAVQEIANQWVKVENQDLRSAGVSSSDQLLPEADIDKVMAAAKNNIFIVVKESLPDDDINGQPSYHFKLGFDAEKFAAFLEELKAAGLENLKITDEQIAQAKEEANKSSDETIDVWITKEGRFISKLSVEEEQGGIIAVILSDYNQPVEAAEPTDAVDFETLLKRYEDLVAELLAGSLSAGSQVSARDAERKVDLTLISNSIEAYSAINDHVPTVAQLKDVKWVKANLPTLDLKALKDPRGGYYLYIALNDDEAACGSKAVTCVAYELSADLEADGRGAKDNDRNTKDEVVTN